MADATTSDGGTGVADVDDTVMPMLAGTVEVTVVSEASDASDVSADPEGRPGSEEWRGSEGSVDSAGATPVSSTSGVALRVSVAAWPPNFAGNTSVRGVALGS
ncbi:MAG: hypothetical protein ACOX8C_08540, partial [Saccharomonospora viridis]|uniref:hypothetical protein n=1 Tax=Saccharomonospora viridis TaxID=1852 RepID=UPI003D932E39